MTTPPNSSSSLLDGRQKPPKREDTKNAKNSKSNIVLPPKKPTLSKAERREVQEKQRALKAARQGGASASRASALEGGGVSRNVPPPQPRALSNKSIGGLASMPTSGGGAHSSRNEKTVELFSHLPQYKPRSYNYSVTWAKQAGLVAGKQKEATLHPAILELGIQYREGTIRGANSRCRAMMDVFKRVIRDYQTPAGKLLSQDLDIRVKAMFQYLTTCRPHSVSMGNAVTFLKLAIANLNRDATDDEAKIVLCEQIYAYVQERIDFAGEAIANHAVTKIHTNDVILTYGRSEVVERILRKATRRGTTFRVIVVDSRPLYEGRELLTSIRMDDIECTYIHLNAISYVMKEVTKVFLGAAALMSNGSVLSRVGTAVTALVARSYNVPVLFCCETYKISHRVQLESITGNELGDPEDVAKSDGDVQLLQDWRLVDHLKLLNLTYDLTPSEYVSGVVTELGILPSTSVAVLLREMNPQDNSEAVS